MAEPNPTRFKLALLGYLGDALVGIELEGAHALGETARAWVKRGYRCEVTTEEDALKTWRDYHRELASS